MDTEPITNCPQCGAPLPPNAPAGLCPRCLMALNLKTETVFSGDAANATSAQPPLPPEQIAPHFPQLEILECLGRGGMGVVYKARQKSLGRLVALKLLAPERAGDPQFAARFEKEARALAALDHPNIVTIHDHGQAGGFYYLLMEFVDGVTLRQLLAKERVSAREALAIVPQICDALQFAHDQGIVHRDIKPENILLDRRGRVKVADFGLAKIVGGNEPLTPSLSPSDGERVAKPGEGAPVLTDAGKVMGTPQYMSPEQINAPGEVDHRADIYALGVVFYQMLTGELPGKKIEAPSKKVSIDVRLDEIVLRALEKKPELRYQQASVLKTQVETIAEAPGGSGLMSAATSREPRFSRTAIVGACWIPFFLIALVVFNWATKSELIEVAGSLRRSQHWSQLLIGQPLVLTGFTAPFVTTILGWIAVSQIRRSARKLNGLWLAVFDGLLFPLLAVNALIIWAGDSLTIPLGSMLIPHLGHVGFTLLLGGAIMACCAVTSVFIIRRVWRAVNGTANNGAPNNIPAPSRSGRLALGWLLGCLLLGGLGIASFSFIKHRAAFATPASLVDSPYALRSLPTAKVIEVGLAKPLSPWAWQEVEKRNPTRGEVAYLMAQLTNWLRREYPDGCSQPLSWLDSFLKRLREDQLMSDQQAIDFVLALHGNLRGPSEARIREGERSLNFHAECRNRWCDSFLGYYLLSEIQSASVDGEPVNMRTNFGRNWRMDDVGETLELPALAPGKHQVKIKSLAALVRADDVEGMASEALPTDWPPAVKRWTRTNDVELEVFAPGAPMVALTQEPELDPVQQGFGIKQAVVRLKGGKPHLVVTFENTGRLPVDISFKATARIGGQDISCGGLWIKVHGDTQSMSGLEQDASLSGVSPEVTTADIVLTPDPAQVEGNAEFKRIWGGEIVFRQVRLKRLDTGASLSTGEQ